MKKQLFPLLRTLLWVALLLLGQGARPVSAASYVVNSLADTIANDGNCTLREAIHAANNNPQNGDCGAGSSADDLITFSLDGTIALSSPLPPIMSGQGRLDISGGKLTISGDQDANNTPDHQIFYVNPNAYLALTDLTLTKGKGSPVGGAVINQGILVVNRVTFSNNLSTGNGGAIANLTGGEAYLYTSEFSLNEANNVGGAIANSGKMLVSESRLNSNSANNGGGAIFNEDTLSVNESTFTSNTSFNHGGAIENSNASSELTIHKSTFDFNVALTGVGGGIYVPVGKLTLVNSTFYNNSAATQGGGVYSAGTTVLANTTLSANSAANGGGIFVFAGSTTLQNTLVANSTGGDCKGTLSAMTQYNLIEDSGANACGLVNGANWNIIGQDPQLGSLSGAPAYFPLLPGSPAIDAGYNTLCADENLAENASQNGVTRPKDGNGDSTSVCDIGAYERTRQPQSYLVNTLNDNTINDSFCSLREAILAANDTPANSNCGVGGGGDDTIEFDVNGIIRLSSTLPNIVSGQGKLTIKGSGNIRINGDTDDNLNGDVRIFWVNSGAHLILEAVTVEYGNAAPNDGGGVANFGTLELRKARFRYNKAAGGGAIANFAGATLLLDQSTLQGNYALNGGGGIANYGSGSATVSNSTIFYNGTNNHGGGFWNAGTLTVLNSTLRENQAGVQGGGIYVFTGGNTTLKNTLISQSLGGGDCVGTLSGANKNNLLEDNVNACGLTNGSNGNILGQSANLGGLVGYPGHLPLLPGSPAINAGDNATCAAAPVSNQSQNGVTRPLGTTCDIGAYEVQYRIFLPLVTRQ